MRGSFIWACAALVSVAVMPVAPAMASDFTIIVPVTLTNLPDGAQPSVTCQILDGHEELLSQDESTIDVVGRDFSGTVTVAVDVDGALDRYPDEAVFYRCWLYVNEAAGDVETWSDCEDMGLDPRDHPLRCGAHNAPVVGMVEGEL